MTLHNVLSSQAMIEGLGIALNKLTSPPPPGLPYQPPAGMGAPPGGPGGPPPPSPYPAGAGGENFSGGEKVEVFLLFTPFRW
jgi:hypothetical protein